MTKGFFFKKKDLDFDLREYVLTLRGLREKVNAPILASEYSSIRLGYDDTSSGNFW